MYLDKGTAAEIIIIYSIEFQLYQSHLIYRISIGAKIYNLGVKFVQKPQNTLHIVRIFERNNDFSSSFIVDSENYFAENTFDSSSDNSSYS